MAGVFELDKLFISPPACNIFIYFTRCLKEKDYFTFLKKKSVHKVASKTRLTIDVRAKERIEARLHKFKHHFLIPSKAKQIFLRVIQYLFTAFPSDNYVFHEKSVSKYFFQKNSSPPPPRRLNGGPLKG